LPLLGVGEFNFFSKAVLAEISQPTAVSSGASRLLKQVILRAGDYPPTSAFENQIASVSQLSDAASRWAFQHSQALD